MITSVKTVPKSEWILVAIVMGGMLALNTFLPNNIFEPIFYSIAIGYLAYYSLSSKYPLKIRLRSAFIGGYFIARFVDVILPFFSKLMVSQFF